MEKEEPHLIRRSFEMLMEEGVQSAAEIRNALPLPVADLEELADLDPGALASDPQPRTDPILKEEFRQISNVVNLFGRKD